MSQYYDKYAALVADYAAYQAYLATLQEGPIDVRFMTLYFNSNLYLDTQPVIPPNLTIDMSLPDGTNLYTAEQADINNIYNFFGGQNYPIGRKFYEICVYYKYRPNEGLADTIDDIKVAYGI